jgi:hypothetical protein
MKKLKLTDVYCVFFELVELAQRGEMSVKSSFLDNNKKQTMLEETATAALLPRRWILHFSSEKLLAQG